MLAYDLARELVRYGRNLVVTIRVGDEEKLITGVRPIGAGASWSGIEIHAGSAAPVSYKNCDNCSNGCYKAKRSAKRTK